MISPKAYKPTKRNWLARVGILSTTLIATTLGSIQHSNAANNQKYLDLFFKQGYEWCDARKLGKIFEESPTQAKVTAGQKIAAGNIAAVRQAWTEGVAFFRKYGFTCGSSSLKDSTLERYAYNDADRVADAWRKTEKS